MGIAADTKAAKQGIETGLIKPLGDAADAADQLGKSRGPDQLERGLKDAQDATERLKRETKETADAIDREYRDAYRKMRQSSDDGVRGAKDGFDEIKAESSSTAKEAAASFDGSAESIGDALQEVTANAFAGFGPAGELAGLVAAAGIGLAIKGFTDVDAAKKASEEAAAEWADAYVEAGGRVLTSAVTTAKALAIITDTEGKFKEAEQNAKNWGVGISTAVAAMAGETWALDAARTSLADKEERLNELVEQGGAGRGNLREETNRLSAQTLEGAAAFEKLTGEMEAGAERADVYSRYLADVAKNTAGATTEVDAFGDSVTTLPDGKQIYIDAETGQATQDTDAIEKKVYGLPDKTIRVTADTSDADRKIRGLSKDVTVTVKGVTRTGNQVW
ncbi:hypothetical protein [Agromyces sp. Root81]|uniref:hypothetical protein n=1 Tax=Agromyces sp. Root81 TaxID=1736601 RepID=UPI0012FCBE8C|nr:hypothetical protein [Agromyces sp. Root81]